MTPERLREAGEALYGPLWLAALARDLHLRSIDLRACLDGTAPIPGPVAAAVTLLLERQAAAAATERMLESIAQVLRRRLGEAEAAGLLRRAAEEMKGVQRIEDWRIDPAAATARHASGMLIRFQPLPNGDWHAQPDMQSLAGHVSDPEAALTLMTRAKELFLQVQTAG